MAPIASLLGVDVGNSKTHVALADLDGEVRALAEGPGASPQAIGVPSSWALIRDLTAAVLAQCAGAEVAAAACAVAGLDFPHELEAFRAGAAPTIAPLIAVHNDVEAVLRAGLAPTAGSDGIAVVVGAGMNGVGRRGDRVVRFPALGAISGDFGGGLMLGEAAIGAACRAEDGRGPSTRLNGLIGPALGVPSTSALLEALHVGAVPRGRLAELARVLLPLADDGDAVSAAIVERQADEIVTMVEATSRRLDDGSGELPVVLDGGVVRAGCRVLDDRVAEGLSARRVLRPVLTPVHGAVLLARDALLQAGPRTR